MKYFQIYFACTLWYFPIIFGARHNCDSLSYRIGVTVRCEHPITGESINCRGEKVPIGAIARYKCDDYYVTLDGDNVGGNMTCNDKGKWTPEHPFRAFTCNMDCGRQLGDNKWPWHATIFKRENDETPFKYACGGTLLNPFNKGLLILTAARCLNPNLISNYEMSPHNVKISLGLFTADFKINQALPEVDIYSVKDIVINIHGEIALIKLAKDITLKENVLPVCFNGNPDFANEQIKEGSYGEFVGFGQPRSSGEFDVLRGISLPVLPTSYCTKYATGSSNICAGYLEGKNNICIGDNGGSIFFSSFSGHSRRNFVQGIYTKLIPDDKAYECEKYGEFTKLINSASWIRDAAVGFYVENGPPISGFQNTDISFQRETPPPISPTQKPVRPILPELSPNFGHHHHNQQVTSQVTIGPQRRTTESYTILKNPDIPISPSRIPNPYDESLVFATTNRNPRAYELVGLEWHNRYRSKHRVPPLVLNAQLNQEAQYEAEQSLRIKKFYSLSGFANWFALHGADLTSTEATKEAVKDWYKSSAIYDRNKPLSSPFTHIVWKSATDMGVGYARNGQDQVVVVKYKLSNIIDINTKKAFAENVLTALPNN